jgi:hypothetical protein
MSISSMARAEVLVGEWWCTPWGSSIVCQTLLQLCGQCPDKQLILRGQQLMEARPMIAEKPGLG